MKVKFTLNMGGNDIKKIVEEVSDEATESDLDELAEDLFWENFTGSYGWEIVE